MSVAFMVIDAAGSLGPTVETVKIFPGKDEAIAHFKATYAPENQEDDDDFENSAPMTWFKDDVEQLRANNIADSGGDIYYVIKEVE